MHRSSNFKQFNQLQHPFSALFVYNAISFLIRDAIRIIYYIKHWKNDIFFCNFSNIWSSQNSNFTASCDFAVVLRQLMRYISLVHLFETWGIQALHFINFLLSKQRCEVYLTTVYPLDRGQKGSNYPTHHVLHRKTCFGAFLSLYWVKNRNHLDLYVLKR